MALLNRLKKKTKKEKATPQKTKERPELELTAEEPKKEKGQKAALKKVRPKIDKKLAAQAYGVVKEPHITEKATSLTDQNKYVFRISPKANKIEVKKAIEALYETKVARVHIIHSAAKKRRLGRTEGWRGGLKKGFKKAIVTLEKGEKIELLPR